MCNEKENTPVNFAAFAPKHARILANVRGGSKGHSLKYVPTLYVMVGRLTHADLLRHKFDSLRRLGS